MKQINEAELRAKIAERANKTSKADLAGQLGISRSYMSQIILGQCPVSDRIAQEFGYTRASREVVIINTYKELPSVA